jgi:hypothetical protein
MEQAAGYTPGSSSGVRSFAVTDSAMLMFLSFIVMDLCVWLCGALRAQFRAQEHGAGLVALATVKFPAPAFEVLTLHFDVAPFTDERRDILQHAKLVVQFFRAKPNRINIAARITVHFKEVLPQAVADEIGIFGFHEKLTGGLLDAVSHV